MDRPLELTKFAENFTASLDGSESEQDIINRFLEAIPLNATEVSQIERETKGQSDSFSWIRHRKGRITASNFKDVCTKVDSLAKARGSVKPPTTPRVGQRKRKEAYNEFYARPLSKHQNCKLTKSGLCVLKEKPYIGASPDGIMTCSCCGTTALEIKCPYSIWDLCVSEAWEQTDFLEQGDGMIQLKRSHKYFLQVKGVMAELHVELIHFDDLFWDNIIPKLDVVLHGQGPVRLEEYNFCPTCEKVILEGEELPENSPDNSIWCDHCGAWFHFVCAQITHIEDDQEWFCQACLLDFVDRELDTTSLVDP
ncbi:uncharacterized protein [Porites lutea]|uniref:uncharacterized protein n=1 Tax=Porites lutea TaxID=51062 RepID=UPI003CC66E83